MTNFPKTAALNLFWRWYLSNFYNEKLAFKLVNVFIDGLKGIAWFIRESVHYFSTDITFNNKRKKIIEKKRKNCNFSVLHKYALHLSVRPFKFYAPRLLLLLISNGTFVVSTQIAVKYQACCWHYNMRNVKRIYTEQWL